MAHLSQDSLTGDILAQRNGWVIDRDFRGRRGGRIVEARRFNAHGEVACLAEIRERVAYEYDEERDRWTNAPTGVLGAPALRPCFATGVIQ